MNRIRVAVIVLVIFSVGCNQQTKNEISTKQDESSILVQSKAFSQAYMDEDVAKLTSYYWEDGVILPSNSEIIDDPEELKAYWEVNDNTDVLFHQARPEKLEVIGNLAYDYGYYSGKVLVNGREVGFGGRYLINWEKRDGSWKMITDAWGRRTSNMNNDMIPKKDTLKTPKHFLIKSFDGTMEETSAFLQSLQEEAKNMDIEEVPYVSISVYPDDVEYSLQGFQVEKPVSELPMDYKAYTLEEGEYISTRFSGNPVTQTPFAIDATRLYAEQTGVEIKDEVILYAGYENEEVFFKIYRALK